MIPFRTFLRRLSVAVLAAVFALPGSPALARDTKGPSPDRLAGRYEGQVMNGDDLDPVLTVFERTASGKWVGTYAIEQEDGIEAGSLDNCEWETVRLLLCRWRDSAGAGAVRLLFSSDYNAFRGFWGETPDTTLMLWDGVKP